MENLKHLWLLNIYFIKQFIQRYKFYFVKSIICSVDPFEIYICSYKIIIDT